MNYQHFIIIRWSIIYKSIFRKRSNDIFDEQRLDVRYNLFKNITFYSLEQMQFLDNTKVIILIDIQLPTKYKVLLEQLISTSVKKDKYIFHTWCDGDILGGITWLKQYIDNDVKILITTRLDDDDALHFDFCKKIGWYLNNKEEGQNIVVTFPYGSYININHKDKMIKYRNRRYAKIGCGLTLICNIDVDKNVFDSDHEFIDNKKYVHILYKNNTKDMFLVANHHFSDSLRVYSNINYRTIKNNFKKVYSYIDLKGLMKWLDSQP